MTDKLSKEKRSWNMSRIKCKDTKPELQVRSIFHSMGLRFRINRKDLPGRPDLILPKHKTAVFVHGCYWHRHRGCKYSYIPKSNTEFWNEKFRKNILRDKKQKNCLMNLGWNVLIIWECQLIQMDLFKDWIKSKFNLGKV
jgi:DNA mismatch endonuclease, patch repair protein